MERIWGGIAANPGGLIAGARAVPGLTGPMVYGICYCPLTKTEELGKMGFAGT